jgi:hypothetical protein
MILPSGVLEAMKRSLLAPGNSNDLFPSKDQNTEGRGFPVTPHSKTASRCSSIIWSDGLVVISGAAVNRILSYSLICRHSVSLNVVIHEVWTLPQEMIFYFSVIKKVPINMGAILIDYDAVCVSLSWSINHYGGAARWL